MKYRVFIDGSQGTTGLEIRARLKERAGIELVELSDESRKNIDARLEAARSADVSILCLPDEASKEIAGMLPDDVRVIDTSTAHRTSPDWVYGLPELAPGSRDAIKSASRVANPGCHATGFIVLARPLFDAGVIGANKTLTCFSLTGYSGGGKKMIEDYENRHNDGIVSAPAIYALGQEHKHLPEMMKMSGAGTEPLFSPVVCDYERGMAVTVPLPDAGISPDELISLYKDRYDGEKLIKVQENPGEGLIKGDEMAGRDDLRIVVAGSGERVTVTAVFDNLGKGASGAAIQNMNIMLGLSEYEGLSAED